MIKLSSQSYKTSPFAIAGIAAALLTMTLAGSQDAFALYPKPDEDGQAHCILHDGIGDDSVIVGPNKCCYDEEVNEQGDELRICIQCDADWKNCDVVSEASRPQISVPSKSAGSVHSPRPGLNPRYKLRFKLQRLN